MKVVFDQDETMNKKIYEVSRLPVGYEPTDIFKYRKPRSGLKNFEHYHGWNISFCEKISFKIYTNSYKDVVDKCIKFFYGSKAALHGITDFIATLSGNAGSVRLMKHKPTSSILYELDSHTKYSIAVNTYDNFVYSKNPHLGWLKCNFQALEDLPPQKKQAASNSMGKESMLNLGGRRKTSTKVEIISVEKATYQDLNTPVLYQQDEIYIENSCVWLVTCLVIRSADEPLSEVLLKKYRDNPPKYEWLYMFNRYAPDNRTLFNYLQWTNGCYFTLKRVIKSPIYNEITFTSYILQKKTD